MKKFIGLAALLFALAGCSSLPAPESTAGTWAKWEATQEQIQTQAIANTARIQIRHVAPDQNALDVYANNALVGALRGYTDGTLPIDLQAGQMKLELRVSGAATIVVSKCLELERGKSYSLLLVGKSPNYSLVVDRMGPLPTVGTNFRFLHALPELQTKRLDVYVLAFGSSLATARPVVRGLEYKQTSNYVNFNPIPVDATGTIFIYTLAGTKTVVADSGPIPAGFIASLALLQWTSVASPEPAFAPGAGTGVTFYRERPL